MNTSQIGVNISGAAKFLQPLSVDEKLAFVHSCGGSGFEIHPYSEWPTQPGPLPLLPAVELARLRERAAGFSRISVHSLMGQTFSSGDESLREEAVLGNRQAIREAAFLGAEAVVIHCRMFEFGQRTVVDRVIPVLEDVAEYGRLFGVRVCLETPTDLTCAFHFLDLFDRVEHPGLLATLDTGHLLSCLDEQTWRADSGVRLYNDLVCDVARGLLERGKLGHVHLNDVRRDLRDHYGMGLGFIDFPRLFGILAAAGYDGMLVLEIHRGDGGTTGGISEEEFRAAVAYVRQHVGGMCDRDTEPTMDAEG